MTAIGVLALSKPTSKPNLPRKKPVQGRSHSTFDAVLEATARILEEGDAARATTNAIAERAGVSIGSLYQYFPSREAIFAEMIRGERTRLMQALAEIVSGANTDIDGAINRFAAAAVDQQLGRPGVARALDRLEPRLMLDEETRALETRIAALFERWLAAVSDRNGLPNPRVGQDVVALVKGMVDAAGQAGETDKAQLTERVARGLRGYLRNA